MMRATIRRGLRHKVVLLISSAWSILAILAMPLSAGARPQADAAGGQADKQQKVAAIKESLAKNQAALKQYTWTETTQISMKGEVKKTEEKQCQYGPDGKVRKTPIGDAAQEQQPSQQQEGGRGRRGGLVKKEVVKKKVDELKDYMEQVGTLVKEYVPPDPQKIQAAQTAGGVSLQPPSGGSGPAIAIKNYAKPDDSLNLGFDGTTKKISSYKVQSYLDNPKDNPVTLAVTFSTLSDGTNYAQQTLLDAPGKKIQVKTTNSNYKKVGQ